MSIPPVTPDGLVSIDGGPELKSNYLATARGFLGDNFLHTTTDLAVGNALKQLASGPGDLDLIGHGSPGMLSTGCADQQVHKQSDNYIYGQVPEPWRKIFDSIKGTEVKSIRLWGCAVGAGQEGLDLLRIIFEATGAPVMAPADFVTWSPNNHIVGNFGPLKWQTVDSTDFVEVIPLPPPPSRPPVNWLPLPGDKILISRIASIAIIPTDPGFNTIVLHGLEAKKLIASLGIGSFPPDAGPPAAFVTHRIEATFDDGSSKVILGIYNNRYVFPADAPNRFAEISSQFQTQASLEI